MCGLIGFVSLGHRRVKREHKAVIELRDLMVQRGPDDAGVLYADDGSWILGHRRLSILDLSKAGHQPLSAARRRVHIAYNGEVYNFMALREELERKGYEFTSTSDTEVLVNLYIEEGVEFLSRLDGMYAFVLIDEDRDRVVIARDQVGKKPLYWGCKNDVLVVASDPGVVARDMGNPGIDPHGLYSYLSLGAVKAPGTLFAGVNKVPPGCVIEICRPVAEVPAARRYYQPPVVPAANLIDDEVVALEMVDSALDQAVSKRMISDVPFGIFLSGGIDSALILHYMSRHTDCVNTFSIETEHSAEHMRETTVARTLAERYGTNHHEDNLSEAEYIEILDAHVMTRSLPTAIPDSALIIKLAALARRHGVYVIETGEGADELFMGYRNYLHTLRRSYARQQRLAWAQPLVSIAFRLAAAMTGNSAPKGLRARVSQLDALQQGVRMNDFFYRPMHSFEAQRVVRHVADGYLGETIFEQLNGEVETVLDDPARYDVASTSYVWNSSLRLSELLLDRMDTYTMACSVEARAPFMDHGVIAAGLQLSERLKYSDGLPKYILRKLTERHISTQHAALPKRGFGGGATNMLSDGVLGYLRSCIEKSHSYNDTRLLPVSSMHTHAQLMTFATLHVWMDQWL